MKAFAKQRIDGADEILKTYRDNNSGPIEEDVILTDLLADLMLWADHNGTDFSRALSLADDHFAAECAEAD